MLSQVEKLRAELSNELGAVSSDGSPVRGWDQKLKIVRSQVESLKAIMASYPFSSSEEEIAYYRYDSVSLYSIYFETLKRYHLEVERINSSVNAFRQYLEHELAEIDGFFKKHHDLVRYFYSSVTDMDARIFKKDVVLSEISGYGELLDNSLCSGSFLLAWCEANRAYQQVLQRELSGEADRSAKGDVYEWNCTDADAAEMIRAFVSEKVVKVNGKDANIKQMTEFWKLYLGRGIGNVYDTIRLNEKRKKDKTPFLRRLMGDWGDDGGKG